MTESVHNEKMNEAQDDYLSHTHKQTNKQREQNTHTHTYKQEAYIFMGMGVNTASSTQMTARLTKKNFVTDFYLRSHFRTSSHPAVTGRRGGHLAREETNRCLLWPT